MKKFAGLHWLLYPLFMLSCAKQTSPTGGPKDTIPPILIKSFPIKESLNFKGNQIDLTFSENITLKNHKEQIIVTPDIGKDYKIESNKKVVSIRLEEKLKDSTTYTFTFRDAIVDLNEQNPARNLKLAFSTGNYIDSLSIEGTTLDLLKSKELKDITVALYNADTFNIFKHKATYITKSDENGNFQIENLKPGKYYLYAVDDRSRNLIVDSKSEIYGFRKDSINLVSDIKDANINLVKLDSRNLKVSAARPYSTYFNIKTTKSIISYSIKSEELIPYSILGEDHASIKVYNTLFEKDSAAIKLNCIDSIGNEIDTVLFIKFNKQNARPEKFEVVTKDFRLIENKGLLTGDIKTNKPIYSINFDSIFYKIDSLNVVYFSKNDFVIDSINSVLHFQKTIDKKNLVKEIPATIEEAKTTESKPLAFETKKIKPGENKIPPKKVTENQLFIGRSAFISIESDSSKKIEETIKPTKLDQTGILFVTIETAETNFIVELLKKDFSTVKAFYNEKKISFEDLPPGDYLIRLIIDRDKNKKWSPGNFFLRNEPEESIFYKNEKGTSLINLRANFEIEGLLIKY